MSIYIHKKVQKEIKKKKNGKFPVKLNVYLLSYFIIKSISNSMNLFSAIKIDDKIKVGIIE